MTSYAALSAYYVEQFHAKVLTLESIERVQTFRNILVEVYWELLKEGRITRIEDLPEEDKKELWAEAVKTSLDTKERVQYCRAIYCLNSLLL